MNIDNKAQQYIYDQEKEWYARLRPFLKGNILKVGNGLGYFSGFVAGEVSELTVVDVDRNEQALNKSKVVIYDGNQLPFKDNSFDCVVCIYVLHHTNSPLRVLDEMSRVGGRLLILEETYTNFFAKLDLVARDIYINCRAHQPSEIHWNSYFAKGQLENFFDNRGLKIIHHQAKITRTYWKELFVAE